MIVAALAVIGWLLGSWLVTGLMDVERAVFAGLSVLVMGYPCAVGISAPLSIVRGAGEAAERGILMRTGEAFQGYRLARTIVLDKTGTLTEGKPKVREIEVLDGSQEELLAFAAAAESSSEHPLAQAIVDAAFERGVTPPEVADFEAVPGKGVRARVGGETVLAGSPRFVAESGVELAPLTGRIEALETTGRTVIAVARSGRPLGLLALGDTVRSEAAEAVTALKQAGVRTVLVTGDNERTAHSVAAAVGIEHVVANVLPGDKVSEIRRLQAAGEVVAMVGDGVNDAPALAQADLGLAIGTGTDVAIEASDLTLVSGDLRAAADAIRLARRTLRTIKGNLFWAFAYNVAAIPLAVVGLLNPIVAAAAMAFSSVFVVTNSLRLRRFHSDREAGPSPPPRQPLHQLEGEPA